MKGAGVSYLERVMELKSSNVKSAQISYNPDGFNSYHLLNYLGMFILFWKHGDFTVSKGKHSFLKTLGICQKIRKIWLHLTHASELVLKLSVS